MGGVLAWIQANWIALIAAVVAIEHAIRLISKLTPWTWDDNIADWLAKLLKIFIPIKKPSG